MVTSSDCLERAGLEHWLSMGHGLACKADCGDRRGAEIRSRARAAITPLERRDCGVSVIGDPADEGQLILAANGNLDPVEVDFRTPRLRSVPFRRPQAHERDWTA
jgi:hypothetical protein